MNWDDVREEKILERVSQKAIIREMDADELKAYYATLNPYQYELREYTEKQYFQLAQKQLQ